MKTFLAHLGLVLLALHLLSSQVVQAQNTTGVVNPTKMPVNATKMPMTTKAKGSCGRTEAFTLLLLPLALATSLLHDWS